MDDEDRMPFGKYKGMRMYDVPAESRSEYLDWLRDQPWLPDWKGVSEYIEKNAKWIDHELEMETEEEAPAPEAGKEAT